MITPDEWRQIERGLEQRVRALNLFLHDIYHEQRILRQGIVPPELVLGAQRLPPRVPRAWTCRSGSTPTSSAATWCATPRGAFFVLEDNLRTPSGVSYLVENRRVLKRTWPQIFDTYDVRPVEQYPQDLLESLLAIAPPIADEPNVVVLTPGVYNSAYFEHAFLAKAMGVELVQGSDLFVDDAHGLHAHDARAASAST